MNQFIRTFSICIALATSTSWAADWPQWRGPHRDGVSAETGLLQEWPEGGPQLRWKATDIGEGYSTPIVVGGRVYLQTTRDDEEFTTALDERTGETIWITRIGKVGPNRGIHYPGTRSTPTWDAGLLYSLASDGELVCLSASDGAIKWQRHMRDDFGGEVGNWAYAESVLIDGDTLVCTPGGSSATLLALNKQTGEVKWRAEVPEGDVADYASIMLVEGPGPRQYVQFLRKGLVGVAADSGKFLWRYDRTADQGANILTPVVHGQQVFSAGSRSGGGLVSAGSAADEVYFETDLRASIGGAVLLGDQLYGSNRAVMFCADFATGNILWRERSVGEASICAADGRLYVRGHNSGDVVLVEPNATEYRERGRLEQPDRSDKPAWPHPIVANGCLYLRDQGTLLCYDVSQ